MHQSRFESPIDNGLTTIPGPQNGQLRRLAIEPEPRNAVNLSPGLQNMRVAIVHHWFISFAGGERVVDTIASIFPTADIFTLFLDKQKLPPALHKHKITTSFLDKIPAARRAHRHLLPFIRWRLKC